MNHKSLLLALSSVILGQFLADPIDYDGTSQVTLDTDGDWSAKFGVGSNCDGESTIELTIDITANPGEADLILGFGTETNYFAVFNPYDGAMCLPCNGNSQSGNLFVTPPRGAALRSPDSGKTTTTQYGATSDTWGARLALVNSGDQTAQWDLILGSNSDIGANTSPITLTIVQDTSAGTTTLTVDKNSITTDDIQFTSTFTSGDDLFLFLGIDDYAAATESFQLNGVQITQNQCTPTDPCQDVTCDDEDICVDGECVRDCDVLDIDAFLQECSTDWTTQNAAIAAIEATMANLQVQIDGNDADIAGNAVDIGTNTGNIATNTGNIGTNTANIATNTGDIGTLQTDLNDAKTNLQGQINDNKDNIDINKGNIDTNTGNIGTNTAGVATNAAAIATNAGGIAANVASIGTNTGNIGTNTQNIAGNAADIGSNSGDIAALQSALSDLQDEVATLRKKLRRKKKQGSAAMPGVDDWDNDDAINDDEWYDNMNKPYPATNSFWDTWSWENIGVIIVCILLMANLIFMTYNNCCNGGNKQRKRYERVGRYMDSEDVDSEANLK